MSGVDNLDLASANPGLSSPCCYRNPGSNILLVRVMTPVTAATAMMPNKHHPINTSSAFIALSTTTLTVYVIRLVCFTFRVKSTPKPTCWNTKEWISARGYDSAIEREAR